MVIACKILLALHLQQSMKLVLTVCISRGVCCFYKSENKGMGVRVRSQRVTEERETEHRETERL